jgi:hypothetical protein
MRRAREIIAIALALVALGLVVAACGGEDDKRATTSPTPSAAPTGGATTPGPGALPPEVLLCFADKGFEIESPAEIHSAPPAVVQECFGALHQGGGAP